MYKHIFAPILRALSQDDPEKAHELARRAIMLLQKDASILYLIAWWCEAKKYNKPFTVWNITFPNRVGIAAGLDKNAEMLPFLQVLGVGHIEFGTVLPRAQTGNPRPRIARFVDEEAVINRLGFNSPGVGAVVHNLTAVTKHINIPLFGSVGIMKDTPLMNAAKDYVESMKRLWRYVQVIVFNISSPNTPGLRDLQGGRYIEEFVKALVLGAKVCAQEFNTPPKPLLVKISPDLTSPELDEVLEACERAGIDGLIIGNTTLSRNLQDKESGGAKKFAAEVGGMSGHPLFFLSAKVLGEARPKTKMPIVFTGGLDSTERGKQVRDLGADLVQTHTPLYFRGPKVIRDLKRAF